MTKQVNINPMKRKRLNDIGLEGMAARWYNHNTRRHRLAEMKGYAKETAKNIQNGSSVLEVAPAPGDLGIELAKLGKFRIIGSDISNDFAEIARRNAKEAGVEVESLHSNVSDIMFPDNTFDFIISSKIVPCQQIV